MKGSELYTYSIDLLHYWIGNKPEGLQVIALAHCDAIPMRQHLFSTAWFVVYVDPSKPESLALTSDYVVDWARLNTANCWQLVDSGAFVADLSDNEYETREHIHMTRRRKYTIQEDKIFERYDRANKKIEGNKEERVCREVTRIDS
jgi:hypothetical protein